MNNISISFTRTDQLCVLVIINTHTFSGLLISWVFIMFMLNIRYFACKLYLSRNNLLSKSHKTLT